MIARNARWPSLILAGAFLLFAAWLATGLGITIAGWKVVLVVLVVLMCVTF